MKKWIPVVLLFLMAHFAYSQSNTGELRLHVKDPSGLGVRSRITVTSRANQYNASFLTTDGGDVTLERLPYGMYVVEVQREGFATASESVEVHSPIAVERTVQLKIAAVQQSVNVNSESSLLPTDQAGSVDQVGTQFIQNRITSVPGRDIQDIVNSQPGWLYEGNAVLHPRGSEYQTQFVVDGIPLTDNRSPSFGPVLEADDVQSISIYTAGIPAEYGRKMGGVVEVNTLENSQTGFHGQADFSGGTFDSSSGFLRGQFTAGKNTFGASAYGSHSDHYLNPVVPQNYTNAGTVGDFSVSYERDLTDKDRIRMIVRHEFSRYEIPNEQVQEDNGQLQTADNLETMGSISYSHTFSSHAIAEMHGMVRDNANDFNSNDDSTPIELYQHNWFREGYFNSSVTIDRGRHQWKAGVESDNLFLNERMNYNITDPTQFDPGSPATFAYLASRPDLEQSAYIQDQISLKNWTINAGIRWDHYQLLSNNYAFEPRLAVSRYFKPFGGFLLHFSYDRVFQTPSFENILLSSDPSVASIDPQGFLRLPVQPSVGDYYEGGLTKVFFTHVRLGANYFRRFVSNYADDSQIFNTTISFPIAFRKAIIYGAEGKLDVTEWHKFSGYASYSYILGNVWNPVTGGLFFGDDAADAASQLSGHFPDSQDQRNTARARVMYQATKRVWVALGMQYDSGLPFDFDGDPSDALAEYGPAVLSRINFDRGRILPSLQANASLGAELYHSKRMDLHFQADGQNLTNVLDVIDFGGLFSGNAIGPSRSFSARIISNF